MPTKRRRFDSGASESNVTTGTLFAASLRMASWALASLGLIAMPSTPESSNSRMCWFCASTPGPPVDPKGFNARENAAHGRVFNQMGLFYYNSKQYEKSAPYFKIAFEFERTNDLYLANLVNAFSNASQQRDALDYLEKQPTSLRGKQALR